MKSLKSYLLSWVVLLVILFVGACEDKVESELRYEAYEPVYLTRSMLEKSVKKSAAQKIENPGKIYAYGDYIFINESAKGVHIVNNSERTEPVLYGFIDIPGNYDISIQDNLLYADNATDLVVIDIQDIENPKEIARAKNVFQEVYPEGAKHYFNLDQEKGIIVDWKFDLIVEKYDHEDVPSHFTRMGQPVMIETLDMSATNMLVAKARVASQTGESGSLARFKIHKNYLYALERWNLHVFDIGLPTEPEKKESIRSSWMAETLFIRNEELFIGTRNGMQIYSLASPDSPAFISSIEHWTACDPVVVQDNFAYVTLRSGTTCGGLEDQLQVISIENINEPKLMKTFDMSEPYGLGIRDELLFICDGNAGLKVYDASDPLDVGDNLVMQFPEIHALDVIPLKNTLLMIGDDGFYQYEFSGKNKIKEISKITF